MQSIEKIDIPKKFKKLSVMKQIVATVLEDEIPDVEGLKILEIGCGDWDYTKKYCEKSGAEWHGIDVVPSIADFKGTIDNIPFLDKTFDIVICNQVLEHIFEYGVTFDDAFKEINRVLKIHGKFMANVPIYNHGHPYFLFNKEKKIGHIFKKNFDFVYADRYYSKKFKGWRKLSNKGFFSKVGYPEFMFPKKAFTHQMFITSYKEKHRAEPYKDNFRVIKVLFRFLKAL
jgi:SAM-dependent methyltransferase